MSRRRTTLEKKIQRDIELALGAEPDLLLLRNSVGMARYVNENDGKEFFVPYGLGDGSPDLVGMLRVQLRPAGHREIAGGAEVWNPLLGALWFCLEIKPKEGDLEPEQEVCHAIWRRFGAFIETVRSVEEARAALERARRVNL